MNTSSTQPALHNARLPSNTPLDQNLPVWARRSNPVVRRELGQYWKRLFPDLNLLARVLVVEALVMMFVPLSLLMTMTLPVMVVSVVAVPVALVLYGRVVVTMIHAAAGAMVDAHNNHTLDLLRVSLVPLDHIILGKVAASLWRCMEDIDLILLAAAVAGMPILTIYHFGPLRAEEVTLGIRVLAAAGIFVLPVRLMLEPFMLASVAVAVGTVSPTRAGAVVVTVAFAVFYVVLGLLPYLMRWPGNLFVLGGMVLPLVMAVVLATVAIRFAVWRVQAA